MRFHLRPLGIRQNEAVHPRLESQLITEGNRESQQTLARFRRRSIVVSKVKRMVDVSIALFARFAGNDRIADLISMLA